jgi:hypothetical protein
MNCCDDAGNCAQGEGCPVRPFTFDRENITICREFTPYCDGVKALHRPTGLSVVEIGSRYFYRNFEKALQLLEDKVKEAAANPSKSSFLKLKIVGWASPHNIYKTRAAGLANGEELLEPVCKISQAENIINELLENQGGRS